MNWTEQLPAIVIFIYLAVVLYIGIFAFRKGKGTGEDFFLASRGVGSVVFFLSIFATNMTAFAILGSSGMSYRIGIGVFGMMASSSALVIPLTLLLIGTRLWNVGKRFGHMTQVAYFRDRWECSAIGTVIFALSALMLLPYLIISVEGGGLILEELTHGKIHFALGGAIVATVVMATVFFGGLRGAVWVNVFQTLLFLAFGTIAFVVIDSHVPGGFSGVVAKIANGKQAYLLNRARMPQATFLSYMLIPLSSIMFPHMAIMCFTAKKVTAFKKTVILYPLSIMAIWLPCVFLGAMAASLIPGLTKPDTALLEMLGHYVAPWLVGILAAGIISAVMGSDCHQILALSTMFTKDIFDYYGGRKRFGEKGTVFMGRVFIVLINTVAYLIALGRPPIFELAVQYAFSGFAALSPIMLAALFWKRSTKWGALYATLWVAACITTMGILEHLFAGPVGKEVTVWALNGERILYLNARGGLTTCGGYTPVVPMVIGSILCVVLGSLLTKRPSSATIEKYFARNPAVPTTLNPQGAAS